MRLPKNAGAAPLRSSDFVITKHSARMPLPSLRATLVLCFATAAHGAVPAPAIDLPTPAANVAVEATADSPLQRGTLPNGFRYALMPRATETGRISLRLIVHAGSLDEHDDERGFAHFVEHMAFNGTKHYPPGKLVPFFQRLGLAFGADANAETSFTSTIYKLDLPAGHAAHLSEALQIFRDYADGIEFASAEVRRERGVILSELSARNTNEWQVRAKEISIYYAGSSLPERLPIGDATLINRAEAPALRRFYNRCYRPERMTLVIVGDIAVEPLKELVAKNFATLHGVGTGADQIPPSALLAPSLGAAVVTTPLSKAAKVELVAIAPVGADTPETVRTMLENALVNSVLNRRLAGHRAAAADHIGRAESIFVQGLDNLYIHHGLSADAAHGDWAAAVTFVENELRRARENGFTVDELKEAAAVWLAALRNDRAGFPGRPADAVANDITSVLAARREWRSPAELLALAENCFIAFTPAVAAERLHATFPDEQLHLVLTSLAVPDGSANAVLAAYRQSATHPLALEAAGNDGELTFHYENFGTPGTVAERTPDADLGIQLVRLSNGVRLNLRPSVIEPHRFRLWARLGRGTPDVPRDLPGITILAVSLMSRSDLGRHTKNEIRRLIQLRAVEGNWTFDDNDFVIQLTGPTDQLPFALKALTAYLADVKLEAAKMSDAISAYPSAAGSILNSTGGYSKIEALFRATGEDARFRLPPQSDVNRYSFETVSSWIRTRWLQGPLEIGIAGDFNVDDAISAALASAGTLSPRNSPPSLADERMTFAAKSYRHVTDIDLPDQAANIRVFWPVRDAADLRVCRALRLGVAALEERLRLKLREELGVTYSPGSAIYRAASQPDFGLVTVELTFPPANALKLAELTLKLSVDFGGKGITKEEFTRLREPLRIAAVADLRSNEWWLSNVLMRAQSQPAVIEEARTHGIAFDKLTRDDVNRAIASHFIAGESNCVGFIPVAALPKKL